MTGTVETRVRPPEASGTPLGCGTPRAGAPGGGGPGTAAGSGGVPAGRAGPLRIVRIANFVTPASGGLRTALRELGRGYRAAGHEAVLIVPGERAAVQDDEQGRILTVPGPVLPGTGGYRVLADRRRVARLLERLPPTAWRSATAPRCAGRARGPGGPGSRP